MQMLKRSLVLPIVVAALAACAEAPTSPRATVEGEPAASALSAVSDARMMDLSVALADARARLLPAIDDARLQAAIQRLDEQLAAEDADGVAAASAQVDAALAALPAGEREVMLADLDALQLTLEEVRVTAAGAGVLEQ
jgi:hypothetical protein